MPSPKRLLKHGGALRVLLIGTAVGIAASACGDTGAPRFPGPIIEQPPPPERDDDGLVSDLALRAVVELQLRRDGDGLTALLDDPSPAVRARAAFALGSVQWAGAGPRLTELLRDEDPAVRRDAAFALGQLPTDAVHPTTLVDAFDEEADPSARSWLAAAIGRAGDLEAARRLLTADAADVEAARTLAVARILPGLEEGFDDLVPALVERLEHDDPTVRESAALYFAAESRTERWDTHADRIRATVDRSSLDAPEAMFLVPALARLQAPDDTDRILDRLNGSEDWRVRVAAARSLGSTGWIGRPGIREALFQALDDPVEQVAMTAANSLVQGLLVPPAVIERMAERIRRASVDRWRVYVPLLAEVGQHHDPEAIVGWTRRVAARSPFAVVAGLSALSHAEVELAPIVIEMADHRNANARAGGNEALIRMWQEMVVRGITQEEIGERLLTLLDEGPDLLAVHAAAVLASGGGFADDYLIAGKLNDVARRMLDGGSLDAAGMLAWILDEEFRDARGTELRAAIDAVRVEVTPDWEFLASLGSRPLLRIRTNRGEILLRLATEQAPITVQTFARQVMDGLHDGIPFHRHEPNFVVQGGDVAGLRGGGGPGYAIPSEFTRIPFQRGVIGMASAGKDTEGSQFFLTHSAQSFMTGQYTAFGWIESGFDVLDLLGIEDVVVRMTIEPDQG